jgi:hypothetical protein
LVLVRVYLVGYIFCIVDYYMYPEVPCPLRLLYSIYTGQEEQCNTTNNYIQSILPT